MILGQHLLLECYACASDVLDNIQQIEALLVKVAKQLNYTIVTTSFHKFAPQGVSGVVVIQESHISLHTWPEYNYAAVDIFTCGQNMDIELAKELLQEGLQSGKIETKLVERGSKVQI